MRAAVALAAVALVLAVAGCGGATPSQSEQAAIPSSVANRLAAQSSSIASAWAAGDHCGAAQQADDLKHATDAAIAAGEIPAAYQDDLAVAVVSLQNTANCDEQGDQGEGNGHGKAKGHDKHDGLTVPTDTIGTTTSEDEQ